MTVMTGMFCVFHACALRVMIGMFCALRVMIGMFCVFHACALRKCDSVFECMGIVTVTELVSHSTVKVMHYINDNNTRRWVLTHRLNCLKTFPRHNMQYTHHIERLVHKTTERCNPNQWLTYIWQTSAAEILQLRTQDWKVSYVQLVFGHIRRSDWPTGALNFQGADSALLTRLLRCSLDTEMLTRLLRCSLDYYWDAH